MEFKITIEQSKEELITLAKLLGWDGTSDK